MNEKISIAIETSCRQGGVAVGFGDEIREQRPLGPSGRHATELVAQLDEMLKAHDLGPADVDELYISAGPGSFTGLRVGITVARTLGQMIPTLKLLAVPTPLAVAENIADQPWQNLGVLLAAKATTVHATLITRDADNCPVISGESQLATPEELMAEWPKPITLIGEGLDFLQAQADELAEMEGVTLAEPEFTLPTVQSVWTVGNRLAKLDKFTSYQNLVPVYARRPEAVRLWEKRHGKEFE